MKDDWFPRVAAAALARFDMVMDHLGLTGGKHQGNEYVTLNPSRSDNKPGSFTINSVSGAWADFATNDKGGDLVSLAAWMWDCKQGLAANRLAQFLGIVRDQAQTVNVKTQGEALSGPATQSDMVCVMPVPHDAPPPPLAHSSHGKPAYRHAYLTVEGEVNFYHDRYEFREKRKQFAPLTLWRNPKGQLFWQFKAPSAPRPMYGLPSLAAIAGKNGTVVLTEGEKAADAASTLLPDHPVVTWQGGAQAVSKADFSPLGGRGVLIWPDNDAAGQKAARDLVLALASVGAGPVKILDIKLFSQSPGEVDGKPALLPGGEVNDGDDAADLVRRGWTSAHMALLLAQSDCLLAADVVPKKAGLVTTLTVSEQTAPRGFSLTDQGVFRMEPDKAPFLVCSPLKLVAQVRDPKDRGWSLLVEFPDPDKNTHRLIVPMHLFSGNGAELASLLLDRGLAIAPGPKARALLMEYLQIAQSTERARITARTGWHDAGPEGSVYVLPDKAIGATSAAWIFESDAPSSNNFATRNTLKYWKSEVAALCSGNSRLLFAVSTCFAAPLLHLTGAESGGFHFRSNSSDGKTTALRVAASVCGGPDYMQRWRATDNGLEALASQHCDAPLLLDELAQIDPKAAGEISYMLANGAGKSRASRTGSARERATWRVLFLSAGEIGLAEHMGEAGKTPRAGQELRLAEIPADAGAGMGIFEDLHGHVSGSEFSKALERAARGHFGTAFLVFLDALAAQQDTVAASVKGAMRSFEAHCLTESAHGQARRVAGRFGLVGAAGELATEFGVTGWTKGEAMAAAVTCFKAWTARRGGDGNQEERTALNQVREFLRRYGESAFTDFERPANDTDKHAPVRSDRAGYRRMNPEADAPEFFVFNEVWRSRVCKGLDAGFVGKLLLARGYIRKGSEENRPWLVKHTLPTEGRARVVHVLPSLFEGADD